jgi:UDP:flavonoid glycosyltransferase YjiC (YdhE family)
MTKVLIMPFGVGLAHVTRTMLIARELKKTGIDVVFAAGEEAANILKSDGWRVNLLPEFTREDYNRKMKKNNFFIYSRQLISQFVSAEKAVLRKENPNAVIFDARFTAKISAKLLNIPVISVANTDMTPYYDFASTKFPIRTFIAPYLPRKVVSMANSQTTQKVLKKVGPKFLPTFLSSEILRLSPAFLRLGYIPSRNPFQFFLGDLTLIVDIPEFRPVKKLPPSIKMVGPIFLKSDFPLPPWHKEIESKKNTIIYITAAGTGDRESFCKTLKFLAGSPFTVVATTGNTLSPSEVLPAPNQFVTDFLPANWVLPKAKLIISPGGNSTVYQALSYGVPQICTPLHLDQEDNANQLERLGIGFTILPHKGYTQEVLLAAISNLTSNPGYQKNAARMKKIMCRYHGAKKAAEEIIKFVKTIS